MKRCPKCGEWKEETEFNKSKAKKDGLSSICRECSFNYRVKPEVRDRKRKYDAKRYANPRKKEKMKKQHEKYRTRREIKEEKESMTLIIEQSQRIRRRKESKRLNTEREIKMNLLFMA